MTPLEAILWQLEASTWNLAVAWDDSEVSKDEVDIQAKDNVAFALEKIKTIMEDE